MSERTSSSATSARLSRSPAKVDGHGAGPHSHWAWWRVPLAPAVFNLDNPAHYINWHFFHMSVANIVVIVLMIVVFIAAIVLPFPSRGRQP
jgi:disulfide bond formation protein DsbB